MKKIYIGLFTCLCVLSLSLFGVVGASADTIDNTTNSSINVLNYQHEKNSFITYLIDDEINPSAIELNKWYLVDYSEDYMVDYDAYTLTSRDLNYPNTTQIYLEGKAGITYVFDTQIFYKITELDFINTSYDFQIDYFIISELRVFDELIEVIIWNTYDNYDSSLQYIDLTGFQFEFTIESDGICFCFNDDYCCACDYLYFFEDEFSVVYGLNGSVFNGSSLLKSSQNYQAFKYFINSESFKDELDYWENQGYDIGYNHGYNDGHFAGYSEGYSKALEVNKTLEDAYTSGFDRGYDTGLFDGEKIGYDKGYQIGRDDGYDVGFDDAKIEAYDIGYSDGKNDGYEDGYYKAYTEKNFSLKTLFWTIAGMPFETFKNIWNVEFLGFNLAQFCTGLLMFGIVLFILKKVFK